MTFVRLYSKEDFDSLPITNWNIKQPAENEAREEMADYGNHIKPAIQIKKRIKHNYNYNETIFMIKEGWI